MPTCEESPQGIGFWAGSAPSGQWRLHAVETDQIILNLGGISYIDSGGLGTLVALYTTAHNAGGSVKLVNLTQRVGDLLQVTKLLTVFEVYDSEEKALESFKAGAAA
jgi:anti-sigma B factor antagonist